MRLKQNVWLTAILGALLLTGFDYLMEPVAIRLGFWTWVGNTIPWTNYVGWFMVSLLLQWANFNWNKSNNPLAAWLLGYQLIYFGILNYFKL
jgi:putative membrane protein